MLWWLVEDGLVGFYIGVLVVDIVVDLVELGSLVFGGDLVVYVVMWFVFLMVVIEGVWLFNIVLLI